MHETTARQLMGGSAGTRRPETTPGRRQSPIDIDPASLVVDGDLPALQFHYPPRAALEGVEITPPGRSGDRFGTVLVTPAHGAAHVRLEDSRYDLLQFHWHSPGEHRLGGELHPIEMHLVHQKSGAMDLEELLVVGVWMDIGDPHSELEKIFGALPGLGATGSVRESIKGFDLSSLLPADLASYRYRGSLTTPSVPDQKVFPETVDWVMLRRTLEISPRQLQAFQALFPNGNCRGVQPLCDRTVLADSEPER